MYKRSEVLKKIKRYCTYQERCHSEVRSKLLGMNVFGDNLEEIIAILIQEDYLNEQRFADSFARGKFRIKKWGRNKIRQHLQRKRISPACIEIGLSSIDEHDYSYTIKELWIRCLGEARSKSLTEFQKNKRCIENLQRRGFEYSLILELRDENLNN